MSHKHSPCGHLDRPDARTSDPAKARPRLNTVCLLPTPIRRQTRGTTCGVTRSLLSGTSFQNKHDTDHMIGLRQGCAWNAADRGRIQCLGDLAG